MDPSTQAKIEELVEAWRSEWTSSTRYPHTPHQEEYFLEWVNRQADLLYDRELTLEEVKAALDRLSGEFGAAETEMRIVSGLSDVAIEMRWLRVLSKRD